MKARLVFSTLLALQSPAALVAGTIFWVADIGPDGDFSVPEPGAMDQGYIDSLTAAGHTVTRYNPPNSGLGPVPQEHIDRLNTGDLIIIGKTILSNPFQGTLNDPQAPQWNSEITKPLLSTNVYLARASRMGWFSASILEDSPGSPLTAVNLLEPRTAWLFAGIAMNESTMVNNYNVHIDRGTSQISSAPVAGGEILATVTFAPTDGNPATFTGNHLVSFPKDTVVRGGLDILGGYRLLFSTGSRETSGVENAGKFDLTPDGETIFLRAVLLTMNNGTVPVESVPELQIALNGSDVTLTWNGPGWSLERSDTMAEASWLPVPGTLPVTVSVSSRSFFRLHLLP